VGYLYKYSTYCLPYNGLNPFVWFIPFCLYVCYKLVCKLADYVLVKVFYINGYSDMLKSIEKVGIEIIKEMLEIAGKHFLCSTRT
jgi:hypothetical protein